MVDLKALRAEALRLLTTEELDSIRIVDRDGGAFIEVMAGGEQLLSFIGNGDDLVERFLSDLQDFISETRFGWGQWREPR